MLNKGWTEYQEERVRHKPCKLHNEVCKIKEAHKVVRGTNFFKIYSRTEEEATTSAAKTDHGVERPDVLSRQWCFSAYDGRKIFQCEGEKHSMKNKKTTRKFIPRTLCAVPPKEEKVYIQDLGTYLYVKLVEDYFSVLSLGRLCDELGGILLLVANSQFDRSHNLAVWPVLSFHCWHRAHSPPAQARSS